MLLNGYRHALSLLMKREGPADDGQSSTRQRAGRSERVVSSARFH
jgi:hypothetical protein